MATTKITNPDLFNLESLNTALKLPSGTTAQRPTSTSTGEWRYNTTTNLVEFWDGGEWRDLQSENIPPINSENFNVVLYTGNGSTQSITGVGFQPDWIAIKDRSATNSWRVFDSTRGLTSPQTLFFNLNFAEDSESNTVSSFDADGFTMGSQGGVNTNGNNYVAYCWKANGGTTSSNTDGSITSTVQANTKAGFSIITWAGTGGVNTVGHGLNSAPELILIKTLSIAADWQVYSLPTGNANKLALNSDAAQSSTTRWDSTNPTSSVFTLNDSGLGTNLVAYAFKSVAGYSSIGSYTGNGSTTGPIINTAFEPAFLIVKRTDSSANWRLVDNKRSPSNPRQKVLFPNLNNAESDVSDDAVDFLTNGFQIKNNDSSWNNNGGAYIYIAFGSDASAAPALADSFANKIYDGNGGTQSITGLGFSPSLVWAKRRSATEDHAWFDILRGVERQIASNKTNGQNTTTNGISSFDTDGWTTGANNALNTSGQTYVAWNWKANPLPTINTDGDTQAIVSANVAAGFSIISYTGTGSVQTVGHGLSAAPEMIILKKISGVQNWNTGADGIGWTKYFDGPNTANVAGTETTVWNDTAPTSTVVTLGGSNNTNANGEDYIMYAWYSIAGFSKMGSYAGTGSSQTITTGFAPNYVMIKCIDQNEYWAIFDTSRFNTSTEYKVLYANRDDAETAFGPFSFTANGFTVPASSGMTNGSGLNYIYMAYKENPTQYAIPSGQMGYLVAAGGGGGGAYNGGGGGAGGFRTTYGLTSGGGASAETNLTLATGTYTITVGAGGNGQISNTQSVSGSSSSVASITTVGGGSGGGAPNPFYAANNGGSGGGGAYASTLTGGTGTANQGFDGGDGDGGVNSGGGGGAASAGANATGAGGTGGNGGNGVTVAITGSNVGYAGGGGGAGYPAGAGAAGGASSGGGAGGANSAGGAGTANTGGGGGGSQDTANPPNNPGGNGGSGVVVLRMNTSDFSGTTSGSPTVSAIGSETILQYLASGSYIHNPSTAAGQMNYMVLSGGASGASNGGGGGSGGLRSSWYASGGGAAGETPLTLSSGTYTITIGGGGAAVTTYQDPGNDGTATTISGNATVNTVGGGGGGSNNFNAGRNGGAGGGAGAHPGAPYNGGSGTAGEGFDGGRAGAVNQPYAGAGGGGTGAVGQANSASAAGAGGDGVSLSITGALANYGGGGGGTGGTPTGGLSGGAGGAGGGAAGGAYNTNGFSASANTGSGGGGSGDGQVSGAGGSGKVILRLITSEYSGTTTGSPTVTTVGTETVLTFTGSGTYVHS